MSAPAPLGEPHNGGRRVSLLGDGWLHKPRTIFWERALLGTDSLFRELLEDRFNDSPDIRYAAALPRLAFVPDPDGGGRVEYLRLTSPPPPYAQDSSAWESLGAVTALLCWLGIGDLHRTNMAFGLAPSGSPTFGPLDIECVLNRFDLPSQSHLLPSPRITPRNCGFAAVREWLDALMPDAARAIVPAACFGYLRAFALLREHGEEMQTLLQAAVQGQEAPIRVVARPTSVYVRIQGGTEKAEAASPPLSPCERFQLGRGDVPYYFRNADSKRILYLDGARTPRAAELPAELTGPIERQALLWPEWRPPVESTALVKAGVLQLANFLLPDRVPCGIEHRGLRVEADDATLRVRSPFGTSVQCARP